MKVYFGMLIALVAGQMGCATKPAAVAERVEYQTLDKSPRQETDVARTASAKAIALMADGKEAEAEAMFKQALTADVMYGPAHNELGLLYYHQKKMYPAAWEFQYAAKLMPNRPEPRNNLGMVLEAAGKLDDAVESYNKAIAMAPDSAQIIGNLVRARIRRGDTGMDVNTLLAKLVERDTRPEWLNWARERLSRAP